MNIKMEHFYDVLVIGSGIAGLSAAIESAKKGCSTAIVTSSHLFSGSSFYPGTWGLGLIGPADDDDIEDLISTIQNVGCHIADDNMVRTFVSNITPAITRLESLGCHPKKAQKSAEREYIPCFDHKHRNWNGLEAASLREAFSKQIVEHQIASFEQATLIDIITENNRICGVILSYHDSLHYIGCHSLVLATGGYGTLFRNHLCTNDAYGLGQYLALKTGGRLINIEFMQMMPGYLSPVKGIVFNEKTFRFANFTYPDGTALFTEKEQSLLDIRSTHGPFTCRLPSYKIDQLLYQGSLNNHPRIEVSYADAAKSNPPEFVKIYFDWLLSEKNISVNDSIQLGIFAHAANGGIKINENGWTGIVGLYACGEITGGMHGADRIGGLSTANGLVFGQRAGIEAASYASQCSNHVTDLFSYKTTVFDEWIFPDCESITSQLQSLMYDHAMIVRNEKGLTFAISEIEKLLYDQDRLPSKDIHAITESRIVEGQLVSALSFLKAALLRRESRGSHFREDYTEIDPNMTRPIEIRWDNGIIADFSK
ncbi:MAG: FAD-binding protein [Lachnospiraceae bacterium]|nr:FAD-binding protein [Lachnospiraceae bacterium]